MTRRRRAWRVVGVAGLLVAAAIGHKQLAFLVWDAIVEPGDLDGAVACDIYAKHDGRPEADWIGCFIRLPMPEAIAEASERGLEPPGGDPRTFLMGAQADDPDGPGYDPEADADEGPPRLVTISPFYLQQHEVSVLHYRWCVYLGGCDDAGVPAGGYATYEAPTGGPIEMFDWVARRDRPVTGVTWVQAAEYCAWVGGRLPTEAEWEYAARMGALQRRYPWGDTAPTCAHAVHSSGAAGRCGDEGARSAAAEMPGVPEPPGFRHLAGNAWEWTADWYAEDAYATGPVVDPKGPATGEGRVQRGGSFLDDDAAMFRSGFRAQLDPTMRLEDVGFRCAADAAADTTTAWRDRFEGDEALTGWAATGALERWGTGPLWATVEAGEASMLWRGDRPFRDGWLRVWMRGSGGGRFGLFVGHDLGDGLVVEADTAADRLRVTRTRGGAEEEIAAQEAAGMAADVWMKVLLRREGGSLVVTVRGAAPVTVALDDLGALETVGLWTDGRAPVAFDELAVYPPR